MFRSDDGLIVALTDGPDVDWLREVPSGPSGPSELERNGEMRRFADVRIVDRSVAWPSLSLVVRAILRLLRIRHFCLVSVGRLDSSQ